MDRTGIIVVAICGILLGVWFFETQKYSSYMAAQQQALNTNVVATAQAPAVVSTPAVPGYSLSSNAPEQTLTLTNAYASYSFTSRGGGIKSVRLLKYPESTSPRWDKNAATNAVATMNAGASAPIMAILGDPGVVGDGDFTLTKTVSGVEAEKSLPNGLVLTKDFQLSSNYLMNVDVTLRNDSGKPLALAAQEWVVGTATPMDIDDISFSTYGGAMWFNGSTYFPCTPGYFATNTSFLGIIPHTPKTEFVAGDGNVYWAAAYNQFFVMLAMPKIGEPAQEIIARPVTLPGTNYQTSAAIIGVQTALLFPSQTLAASQVLQRQMTLYAGPKEFWRLEKIGDALQNHADLAMNFGTGFSGFWGIGSFFAKILLLGMNELHALLPALSYGWIIVLLTVLLRLVFWPLLAASMRSAKKMQALAPELKALKEKYKDEPQKLMQKQTELWRKNNVNPVSGCLPMLIQTPVFLGFFTMIRSAIELRGAHFLWISDLTKTDTLFVIPGVTFIPFFSSVHGLPLNLLPLLMVGVMVWQAHLQPPSPGMDPGQQKLMRYMPLIFLVIFYNYSAAMALYLTVSTLMSVLQMRLIRNVTLAPAVSPLTPPQKKKK